MNMNMNSKRYKYEYKPIVPMSQAEVVLGSRAAHAICPLRPTYTELPIRCACALPRSARRIRVYHYSPLVLLD